MSNTPRARAWPGARRPRRATSTCAAHPSRAPTARAGEQPRVRVEPLRALPPRAGEERRAQCGLPLIERRQPELARPSSAAADAGCRRPRGTAARRALGRTGAWSGTGRSGSRPPRPGRRWRAVAIHSATCWPIPPPCVTHTASQTQRPRTFADSPTMEPASGVNENMPLIERAGRPAASGPPAREQALGLALGTAKSCA